MTHTPPPTQDDLSAGRELDNRIHVEVLGKSKPKYIKTDDNSLTSYLMVPAYSTDISAAWLVLDEMVWRVGTANIRIDMEDYGRGAGTWGGAERAVWVTIGEYTVVGPAPLAICKAALKVVSETP